MRKSEEERLAKIEHLLQTEYGLSRHGNVRDGFWELVYILFSIRTSERCYRPAFKAFRNRFRTLSRVANAKVSDVARFMRPLGLSNLRAKQLITIARTIEDDYGSARFNRLGKSEPEQMESYLRSFHGIGAKVAKCVTMYAYDADSLPVDTHVWRVLSRLGYAPGGRLSEQKALELEERIPANLRYALHVLSVSHGRTVCRSKPLCDSCVLAKLCPSRKKASRDNLAHALR